MSDEPLTDVLVSVARVIDSDGTASIWMEMSPGRPFEVLTLLEQAKFHILKEMNEQ